MTPPKSLPTRFLLGAVLCCTPLVGFTACEEKPQPNPLQSSLDQARFDIQRLSEQNTELRQQLKEEMLNTDDISDEQIKQRIQEMQTTINTQQEVIDLKLDQIDQANQRIAALEKLLNESVSNPDTPSPNNTNNTDLQALQDALTASDQKLAQLQSLMQNLQADQKQKEQIITQLEEQLIARGEKPNNTRPRHNTDYGFEPVFVEPNATGFHINDFLSALKNSKLSGYKNVSWGQSLTVHFNERQWFVHETADKKYTLEFRGMADESFTTQFTKLDIPVGTQVSFIWKCNPKDLKVTLQRVKLGDTDVVGDLTPLYRALAHIF